MLCQFFSCTSKAKYASIPNIHVALHYQQDILNYGTPHNVSVMIGEQKHKIHKVHAPHTNSRDTELQLLKAVNLSQTIRFMLDGVHSSHQLSDQFERIVGVCPVLRNKFLGASQFLKPVPGNIESDGVFARSRVGLPLSTRTIPAKTQLCDSEALLHAWNRVYKVRVTMLMIRRFSYWSRMTCQYNHHNHIRKLSMWAGGFVVHTSTKVFYQIVRITSISIGEIQRGFLICRRLIRDEEQEANYAPYDVYTLDMTQEGYLEVLTVSELEPMNVHFVRKSEDSWWWNPHTTHFL
jgi:hypothetical protein